MRFSSEGVHWQTWDLHGDIDWWLNGFKYDDQHSIVLHASGFWKHQKRPETYKIWMDRFASFLISPSPAPGTKVVGTFEGTITGSTDSP